MTKKILFGICMMLFTMAFYLYLAIVFMPKDTEDMGGEKYYAATSYKDEPQNSLEIMLYGNSDLYNGFSPIELYKEKGFTSFACGMSRQTVTAIRQQIETSIKLQNLKLIVLDADCFFTDNDKNLGSIQYENIIFQAPIKYHTRWKELELKDFFSLPTMKNKVNYMKGYICKNYNSNYKLPDTYMSDISAKPAKLQASVEKELNKINELCIKNDIKLMIMTIPTPITWTYAKHYCIENFVNKLNTINPNHEIKFLDMNTKPTDFNFDFNNHFADNGNHCNYEGAKIVTKYVGDYIASNYNLEDKRIYENYFNWKESVKLYDKRIATCK